MKIPSGPWRKITDRARAEADDAEKRLREAQASRVRAEKERARALQLLAENHISPKLAAIFREGKG